MTMIVKIKLPKKRPKQKNHQKHLAELELGAKKQTFSHGVRFGKGGKGAQIMVNLQIDK